MLLAGAASPSARCGGLAAPRGLGELLVVVALVVVAFLGSGSTLIAAERLGRGCFGIELDPRYVDVAVLRWQAFTGEKATKIE